MTEVEQQPPPQNGIDLRSDEDENNITRPADIEQDMREMDRRKRVEAIMGSKLFREELERIVDSQIREGGASGILQQLSDIVGVPASRVGSVFKSSNCVLPINDIRGIESMGYAKGEKILRCKLAATFRLLDLYGWTQGLGAQITARLNADQELFLVNPFGLLFHEVTASSLNKVDMQGNVVEQGTTNFGINNNHYILHSVVHSARPDIRCAIYLGCNPVVAVSSLKAGILPLTKDAALLGEISTHPYTGALHEPEEREKLVRSLGPISKVLLLNNHGAVCCGETIEEAFFAAYHIVQACETQLKLLPVGLDNLVLIPEESRKAIYDASRRPPDGFEAFKSADKDKEAVTQDNKEKILHQKPKWRVGGAEYEALMRMLDNAGFRTGYIYRHPLVKSELPKPKNDVEVPPAVSSLGYLLEEEELYRQGIWKKGEWRKGGDRTKWLNSPNVYQKVEVLETGTPDPKKITKWVADGSPTHSNAVRIEHPLQFVPVGTNPKEFKRLQQQIKDNRRADKISAGPQSHILEGVTWDEANRIKENTVTNTGDHVVLMGAASKGIIQRGYQHNATVYKAPYAKNPFDNVTDDELNEYKKTVEKKKKNIHGEYTDTDFSESEALSSLPTSGAQQKNHVLSQSEPEDASEHQVMRIETKQAPKPSQPEVVLSDAAQIIKLNNQKSIIIHNLSSSQTYISIETLKAALKQCFDNLLVEKYEFLYKLPQLNNNFNRNYITCVIHKVQMFPILKSSYIQTTKIENLHKQPKPYRTVSHFGFNYPIASGIVQTNSEIKSNYCSTTKSIGCTKKCSTLFLEKLKSEEIESPPFISRKKIDFVRCDSRNSSSNCIEVNNNDDDLESLIESEISIEEFGLDLVDKNYQFDDKLSDLHLIRREFDLISEPESENTNRIFNNRNNLLSIRKRPLNFSQTTSEASTDEIKETLQNNSNYFRIIIEIKLENAEIKNSKNFDKNFIINFENLIKTEVLKIISNYPNSSVFIEVERNPSFNVNLNSNQSNKMNNECFRNELNKLMFNVTNHNDTNNVNYRSVIFEYRDKISILIHDIQKFINELYID